MGIMHPACRDERSAVRRVLVGNHPVLPSYPHPVAHSALPLFAEIHAAVDGGWSSAIAIFRAAARSADPKAFLRDRLTMPAVEAMARIVTPAGDATVKHRMPPSPTHPRCCKSHINTLPNNSR